MDPDYPADGLVVVAAGAVTLVDPIGPGDGHAVVAVADLLQDLVMDELGRGWPEQYSDDKFIGLLRPGLDDSGEPCRIGELS